MSNLENHVIKQVACGKSHSLAINVSGQLFAWGSNSSGQLGHDSDEISSAPKLVRSLAFKQVVQIASGHYHSLALTSGMLNDHNADNILQDSTDSSAHGLMEIEKFPNRV